MAAAIPWDKIKAEYIAGGISCRELAEKYGISEDKIKKRSAKEKWTDERRKVRTNYAQKVREKIVQKKADAAIDDLEVAKYTVKVFQEALRDLALLMKENPLSQNLRNVESLANAINKNVDSLMKTCQILNAGEQKKLELEERRLKLEEEKFHAQQAADAAGGSAIRIEFADEAEEYSE